MHPYLRAYLAGIALPTMVIPLILVALMVTRPTTHDFHIEDVVIFPLSLVPNAWGLWNMLYVWIRRRRQINAGIYGALLVVAIVPLAFGVQFALGKFQWTPELFAIGFPVALVGYYLAWKFVVSGINDILGVG